MPSITHIISPLTAPEAVENEGDSTPNYTMLTMKQEVVSISFNAFPHWNSMVSLETFFGDHNSNVTELMSIFNNTLDLKLPQSTSVTNKVINGSLVAIVEWVNSLETEEFSVLGFTIRVNVMWIISILKGTVSSAGNTTGYYSDPIGLLDEVKLTPLVQLSIKHLVRDILLIVILEWKKVLISKVGNNCEFVTKGWSLD